MTHFNVLLRALRVDREAHASIAESFDRHDRSVRACGKLRRRRRSRLAAARVAYASAKRTKRDMDEAMLRFDEDVRRLATKATIVVNDMQIMATHIRPLSTERQRDAIFKWFTSPRVSVLREKLRMALKWLEAPRSIYCSAEECAGDLTSDASFHVQNFADPQWSICAMGENTNCEGDR